MEQRGRSRGGNVPANLQLMGAPMSRLLASAAAVAMLSTAAYSADLPLPEEPMPVAAALAAYNWTGFYIGAQGGWGWGESDVDDGLLLDDTVDLDGFFVGGLAGAQWQWNWAVLGLEVEGNWADIDGDEPIPPPADNLLTSEINSFGSLSGKLGVAWDRVLLYGTGGLAVGDIETGQSVPSLGFAFSDSEIYFGWTAGAGIDVAVTNHIIVGAQYRFYDFGDEDFDSPAPFTDRNQETDLHTISGHVTWKFP
jgi:outer membrane immunogenic protein